MNNLNQNYLIELPNELKKEIFIRCNFISQLMLKEFFKLFDHRLPKSNTVIIRASNRFLNKSEINELIKYNSFNLIMNIYQLKPEKEYIDNYLNYPDLYYLYCTAAKYNSMEAFKFFESVGHLSKVLVKFEDDKVNEYEKNDKVKEIMETSIVFQTQYNNLNNNLKLSSDSYKSKVLYKAIKYKNQDAVRYLLEHGFKYEQNIFLAAAKSNNLDMFKMILYADNKYIDNIEYIKRELKTFYKVLASKNNIEFLEFLYGIFKKVDNKAISIALKHGYKDVIIWACNKMVPLCPEYCDMAAISGDLDLLVWIREIGCPWNENVIYSTCKGGNILMLEYIRKQWKKYPDLVLPFNSDMVYLTAEYNHLNLMKYLISDGCPYDTSIFYYACKNKNYEMIEYCLDLLSYGEITKGSMHFLIPDEIVKNELWFLIKNPLILSLFERDLTMYICNSSNIELIEDFHKNIFPITEISVLIAERNYEVLEWCLNHGIEISDEYTKSIIKYGDLNMFMFCIKNGYIPTQNDLIEAVKCDNVQLFEMVFQLIPNLENQSVFKNNDSNLAYVAAKSGSLKVLKYLYQSGYLNYGLNLYNISGHRHVIGWLHQIKYPNLSFDTTTNSISKAIGYFLSNLKS